MAHPMCAGSESDFRLNFDPRVRLEFQGSKISSDGGLLLSRELDEALGLFDKTVRFLRDTRIEDKQRVIAVAPEMPIPCGSLLSAMGGADRAFHVQCDPLGWLCIVHGVDPLAGQVSQSRQIMSRSENVSLEPRHLAGRGRMSIHGPPADDLAHHWITR